MTELVPFQLSLDAELEGFRPEIEYVCRFLERAHGLRFSQDAGNILHYGSNPPAGAVTVPAVFFPHGVKVSGGGLVPERTAISGMFSNTSAPFLFPSQAVIGKSYFGAEFTYDALGLIFFLISRIEERDPPRTDRHGRFPYSESFFNRMGGVGTPWADHAARDIAAKLMGTQTPANQSQFSVVLTHDVDRLKGYHKVHLPLRYALGDLIKRGQPQKAIETLKKGYLSEEPWKSINRIMELSEERNLISRFFFMPPSQNAMDSTYANAMRPLLKKVVDHILRRGHMLGFHPGYNTATDLELWLKQKNALESILDCQLTEGRQHVLQYEICTTPAIWDCAGMETDYTLAFPDAAGFRTGTCRAYAAYDLKNRKILSVEFVATAITDFGLMDQKYQNFTAKEAINTCRPIIQSCREFDGSICVLFHSSNLDEQQNVFYETLMKELL